MTTNEIEALANDAMAILNQRITDEIFLVIQSDRSLMQRYLQLVERAGAAAVNRTVGKEVKRQYALDDADSRENDPKSTLIQSHQSFK